MRVPAFQLSSWGPRRGEASQAACGGGGWGVVGREEPGLGSAAVVAAALSAPEAPEENPGAARPERRPLCRPVRTRSGDRPTAQRRPAPLRRSPPCGAAPQPGERGGGEGHGLRRRRGRRKMAAGKSGGSSGEIAFLEGTSMSALAGLGWGNTGTYGP